jgi:transposase
MGRQKYSFEFKKHVVSDYLNGEGGYRYLESKYNVSDKKLIRQWVSNYKAFGDSGLLRSRKKEVYSFKKKLSVVELYLSSELSYQELAIQEGINNPSVIAAWVNRFRIAGPDALRPHKKGRKKTLDKPKINNKSQEVEEKSIDTSAEHVKELEDELLKLRIENAFLKELRRLRLEDEAKMRERRSSSTASEENSD